MEEHSPRGYSQATLRYVQWLFALISFSLFQATFGRSRTSLSLDKASDIAVRPLNLTSVIYSTVVILMMYLVRKLPYASRYKLEMVSVPFDLLCAGVYLAKGAILNSTRLACEGLVKEKFFQNGVSRDAFRTTGKTGFNVDDVDQQCAASMFIYWLCHIAILSYIFSVMLAILRIKEYREMLRGRKRGPGALSGRSDPEYRPSSPQPPLSPTPRPTNLNYRSPGRPSGQTRLMPPGHRSPPSPSIDVFGSDNDEPFRKREEPARSANAQYSAAYKGD